MKYKIGTTIDLITPQKSAGNCSSSAFNANARQPKPNALLPAGMWTLEKIKNNLYTFTQPNGSLDIEFDDTKEADEFIKDARGD